MFQRFFSISLVTLSFPNKGVSRMIGIEEKQNTFWKIFQFSPSYPCFCTFKHWLVVHTLSVIEWLGKEKVIQFYSIDEFHNKRKNVFIRSYLLDLLSLKKYSLKCKWVSLFKIKTLSKLRHMIFLQSEIFSDTLKQKVF